MLPETQQQRIREEAERLYPGKGNFSILRKQGYILAATRFQEKLNLEIEKAKVLVEGLEQVETLCENWFLGNDPQRIYRCMRKTINETLDTYNKTINNG